MNALPDPTRTPVLIAALRTPVCRVNGSLAAIEPASLAALLIENIVANTGIDRGEIDDVLVGNAANSAGNLARLAALEAGLPISIP
ncbi:acetyl-CoA acetyltransferase, partial [Sinorhizobium medicae]